jgi:outer membrane protein OmpA-like peptidoglycan-associated protein
MGGYDVFRSIYRNGGWTTPTPMPYAFNNTIDNTFFILNNNAPGFITSYYDNITKTRNIFSIIAEDPSDRITLAVGTVSLQDGMNVIPNQTRIQLADLKKDVPVKEIALADTSSYRFEVKPGDYKVIVSHTGYQTDTINLNVPLYYLSNYISINSSLIPDKVVSGDFLSIKTILFDFDSYKLNDEALSSLEILKSTLNKYPELLIEVAGFTDSKGSSEYNNRLADRRAAEVIKYFTNAGITRSRFVKKAYGESNFAAVNTNLDGTDNPEGRKYNRRVTFGIVDPQTGITLSQETFTPDHLRQPYSMRYSIVLKKTTKKLPVDFFDNLKMTERYFMRTISIDSVTLHIMGVFYNKNDALKYLEYAKGKGYTESYIVTQFEINSLSRSLIDPDSDTRQIVYHKGFTIQLKAARRPINMKEFKDIAGVREVLTIDGYYRYLCGEYRSFSKAKEELPALKATGFSDAFVRDNDLVDLKKKIK